MKNIITIGVDEGTITPGDGDYTITLSGLSFTPTIESIAYIFNKTQNKLYFAQAEDLANCTISGLVITIDSTKFNPLSTADEIHIQMWIPQRAYDYSLDNMKSLQINPEYAHYTDTISLVEDTDLTVDTHFKKFTVDEYRNLAIQLASSDATGFDFKIYATLDPDATEPITGGTPGAMWIEVTSTVFGGAVTASGEDIAELAFIDTNKMPDAYLIEYAPQNATNTVNVWIRKY